MDSRPPRAIYMQTGHRDIYGVYYAIRKNVFIRADLRNVDSYDTVFYRNFYNESKWTVYRNSVDFRFVPIVRIQSPTMTKELSANNRTF